MAPFRALKTKFIALKELSPVENKNKSKMTHYILIVEILLKHFYAHKPRMF